MNKNALDEGYEGLMIKPINDIYECKRALSNRKMTNKEKFIQHNYRVLLKFLQTLNLYYVQYHLKDL